MLVFLLKTIAFIIGFRILIYKPYIRLELPIDYVYGSEYSQKWYHFQFFNAFVLPIFIKVRAMIKRFLRSKDTDAYLEIRSVRRLWNFMFNDTTIIPGINVSSTTCGVKSENSIMEGLEFEVPIYIFTPENFDDQRPTMFYYHGGGWSNCSVQTHRQMLINIILNL